MHKLFTHFGKALVQSTGPETSTAIGLATGEEIAELYCGKMYTENPEGRVGARFTIELDMQVLAVYAQQSGVNDRVAAQMPALNGFIIDCQESLD